MIVVSSRNRISGHIPSKFRHKSKDPIQGQYNLAFATIPKTDPVFSTSNNKLVISIGASSSPISLSTTTYTVAEFILDFQTKINAVSKDLQWHNMLQINNGSLVGQTQTSSHLLLIRLMQNPPHLIH